MRFFPLSLALTLAAFPATAQEAEPTLMQCAGAAWMVSGALEADIGIFEDDRDMSEWLSGAAVILTMAAAEDDGCTMDGETAFATMMTEAEAARLGMIERMTTYGILVQAQIPDLVGDVEACMDRLGQDRISSLAERWSDPDNMPCGWES